MTRNDTITRDALWQLNKLVMRAGRDLDRAAIGHLATDLGYTLSEIQAPLPDEDFIYELARDRRDRDFEASEDAHQHERENPERD